MLVTVTLEDHRHTVKCCVLPLQYCMSVATKAETGVRNNCCCQTYGQTYIITKPATTDCRAAAFSCSVATVADSSTNIHHTMVAELEPL